MQKGTVNQRLTSMHNDSTKAMEYIAERVEAIAERQSNSATDLAARIGDLAERVQPAVEMAEYFALPLHKRIFAKRPR